MELGAILNQRRNEFMQLAKHVIAVAALLLATSAQVASAQGINTSQEIYETYRAYEGAYDTNYADDWFYDSYSYAAEPDEYYDTYGDFDYEAGVFTWEEEGLF
nr:MAG: hypothetical protein DIU78_02440 [Pseudomonadota bacterium]